MNETTEQMARRIDARLEISKIVGAMLDSPQDCGIYQTTKCYDALEALFVRLLAEQQKQEPATWELRKFVHDITLELQQHRSRTEEQKDRLFQRAYALYVKYNVDKIDDTAAPVEQQKQEPVATFVSRRVTPQDTTEFYGYLTDAGAITLQAGDKLYAASPQAEQQKPTSLDLEPTNLGKLMRAHVGMAEQQDALYAKRYRWLRSADQASPIRVFGDVGGSRIMLIRSEIDDAIDAAMREKEE